MAKTFAEQLADLKATRDAKHDEMKAIGQKSIDKGQTMDTGEAEQFDALQGEIKRVDADIARITVLAEMDKQSVKGIDTADKTDRPAIGGSDRLPLQVKNTEKLEAGMSFARMARVKALAFTGQAGIRDEVQIAKSMYPSDETLVKALTQKAAVPAANTLSPTWAGNLINEGSIAFADFVEYLRPRTLYGQIAPRFRNLPFDTPVLIQGTGGDAQWVKEGEAKPVTQWTYTRAKLTPLKVAAIAAATKETLMRASVSADAFLRDELARAVGSRIDQTIISDAAAVADESPAGLLNGTAPLVLTGDGSVEGVRCDAAAMLKALVGNNLSASGAFWVMPETTAIDLSTAVNAFGAPAFPGVTPTGGTFLGLPVFASQYVPSDSAGPVVALIKGDEVFLGDEGGIQVSVSDQASIQMDSAPTQNSITPTATTSVSMFQTNSVAFLVERFLNWQKRRSQAVVWANVNWNACA